MSVAAIYVDGGVAKIGGDTLRIVFEAQNLLFGAASAGLDAGTASIGFVGLTSFSLFVLVTGITMAAGKASLPATPVTAA